MSEQSCLGVARSAFFRGRAALSVMVAFEIRQMLQESENTYTIELLTLLHDDHE